MPAEPDSDKPAPAGPPPLRLKASGWVKRILGKLWATGGGGFYGCGYVLYFLYLEALLLVEDVGEAAGVFDFLAGQLVERIMRFAVDSLINSITAFLWPIKLVMDYRLWGIGILIVGSMLYARYAHQRIVDFLGIDPAAEKKAADAAKRQQKKQAKAERRR